MENTQTILSENFTPEEQDLLKHALRRPTGILLTINEILRPLKEGRTEVAIGRIEEVFVPLLEQMIGEDRIADEERAKKFEAISAAWKAKRNDD